VPKDYFIPSSDDDCEDVGDIYKYDSEVINLPDVQNFHPKFSYTNISLDGSNLCFNNIKIDHIVFIKYFEALKELSGYTIQDFFDGSISKKYFTHFSFEQILRKKEINSKFLTLPKVPISKRANFDFPITGQFGFNCSLTDLNGKIIKKAPRIFFVIGKYEVFHLIFFDLDHNISHMPGH
jgi:hypothetical protein